MVKRILVVILLAGLLVSPLWAGQFDQQRARDFIELCHNVTGRQPNLGNIYWKLRFCEAAEQQFEPASYVEYILSLQNDDGGFGLWPKDASTPEPTLDALTLLRKAQAQPRNRTACISYLNSCLLAKAKASAIYSDLEIQRDIYACLICLSLLEAKVPELDRYLKILEQDSQGSGIYYRLTAAKTFGRPLSDRKVWIKKLDDLATEHLRYEWRDEDWHYAFEAMGLLGGRFKHLKRIRKQRTPRLQWEPWDPASAWRRIRMAKLLGVQPPWLESWLKKSISIKPAPVGGYAAMPGLESDLRASLLARGLLRERGAEVQALPAWAEQWQDKQQQAGYYESSPKEFSRWFTKADQLPRWVDHTWEALSVFQLAGAEPADRQALVGWLNEMIDKHRDALGSQHILRVLECFGMLGEQPANSSELAEYIEKRFGHDLIVSIKALTILGREPELKNAGDRLSLLLDRVRVLDIPMEISVLAATFQALDAIGEDYAGTAYFLELLSRLQNADGGLRKPDSVHSNIYDTIAALRMAKVLPVLKERYKSRRKRNLVIRAPKTAQPVVIDGKLSEWNMAAKISFEEHSDRPEEDRNSTEAYAMWDDAFLYLAWRVRDTNLQAHVTQSGLNVYRDDGIEFLIDPNCDRTRTYMPDDVCVHINLLGAVLDDRGTANGSYDFSWNSNVRSAFALEGTLNNDSDKDLGYTAEVMLAWSELGWKPGEARSRLGINLCVNDRDRKEDGYRYSDWGDSRKFHVPRDWGEMEFVPAKPQ